MIIIGHSYGGASGQRPEGRRQAVALLIEKGSSDALAARKEQAAADALASGK